MSQRPVTRGRRVAGAVVCAARRLAREQGGWTLMELLTAMVLMIVMLSALLGTFSLFERTTRANQLQNDSQQRARAAMINLVRELRNTAGSTEPVVDAVEVAGPYDIVFKTVDPAGPNSGSNTANTRRARYCVGEGPQLTGPGLGGEGAEVIYLQVQAWTEPAVPALPDVSACPGSGWDSTAVVADSITNRQGGQDRPLFRYDATDPGAVAFVRIGIHIDVNPGSAPGETRLEGGVYLRNQNRAPAASFVASATGNGRVLLNGSASSDPDGDPLAYSWLDSGVTIAGGDTAIFEWTTTPGSHSVTLEVRDGGGLLGTVTQTVVVS